jgi:D-alanyl-D-alanine carboxypeptidase/D-alanyl-D-alanine-endopeptidase (penicillin-binding protein 4)
MLTKELGARFGGKGSIPAGTVVITDALTAYGVHPRVADGSGLSRSDRTSPREVVSLLRSASSTPQIGQPLQASLPLVGVNGTTRRIAKGTVARGRCLAKTGTLDYVTNLAGYCSAAGGQQLAFAIFIDGPTNEAALAIEGRMVADMVRLNAAQP